MILSATSLEGVRGSIIVRAKGTEQEWAGYVLPHLATLSLKYAAKQRRSKQAIKQAMAPAGVFGSTDKIRKYMSCSEREPEEPNHPASIACLFIFFSKAKQISNKQQRHYFDLSYINVPVWYLPF